MLGNGAKNEDIMKKSHIKKIKPVKQESTQLTGSACIPASSPSTIL